MARVNKMKVIHAGDVIENEAKEYPADIPIVNVNELDKIQFINGKMVIVKGVKTEKHTR